MPRKSNIEPGVFLLKRKPGRPRKKVDVATQTEHLAPSVEKEDDIYVCPICFENMLEEVCVTSCGHMFHKSCLMQHKLTSDEPNVRCPLCRVAFPFARNVFITTSS